MPAHLQRGTIAFVVALVVGASTAEAASHHRLEHCSKRQPARTELACAQHALWHNAHAALWIKNHKSRTLAATSWTASHYWRTRLKFYRWRVRVNRYQIAEARHRLWRLAPVPSRGGIAHMALWLCIHKGEGAWNDEGAPYYGGLQMTYGWGGLVADAAKLSPADQMRAAETGYRQSGYSTAWLQGQWPNTSPPCLGYA